VLNLGVRSCDKVNNSPQIIDQDESIFYDQRSSLVLKSKNDPQKGFIAKIYSSFEYISKQSLYWAKSTLYPFRGLYYKT
jgi:hypothetical protein